MAYGYLETPAARTQPPQAELEQRRVGYLVNLTGAAISVALVAGVGLWSYRLMVRDVSGVPVVRALDGPMRVSPEDPGGRQAAYQGLAVNSVAASGAVATGARQIALAPAATDIAPEDRIAAPAAPGAVAAVAPVTPAAGLSTPEAGALAQLSPEDLVPLGTPGIARSPLPPRRPGRIGELAATAPAPLPLALQSGDALAEAALQEIATRLGGAPVTEIDPTSLTAGTRLVQLGAFETEGEARAAWDALSARFPGYLDGRARVVEAATAGGRIFYRLRAHGFRDEPEARRFCSVFVTEEVDCTPVLIR